MYQKIYNSGKSQTLLIQCIIIWQPVLGWIQSMQSWIVGKQLQPCALISNISLDKAEEKNIHPTAQYLKKIKSNEFVIGSQELCD